MPGFYISDPSYNNYERFRNYGRGDPCRLAGYLASEIRNWTEAQFNDAMERSEWRIATAKENALYVGENMATSSIPAIRPQETIPA